MVFLRKNFFTILLLVLIGLGGLLTLKWKAPAPEQISTSSSTKKSLQVVEFGVWQPEDGREILGTVKSSGHITLQAEVAGTLERVLVKIGDRVKKGQILARFQQENDLTHIAYENAKMVLEGTQRQALNDIRAAEIALQTAQREYEQTAQTQEQNTSKAFQDLKNQTRNAETVGANVLDWEDQLLGASIRFQHNTNFRQHRIGIHDSVGRQKLKVRTQELVRDREALTQAPPTFYRADDILRYAESRLVFLREVQDVARRLDYLIRTTPIASSFTEEDREALRKDAESFNASIDADILSLETQIETAKAQQKTSHLAVLSAKNKVDNAEANLQAIEAKTDNTIINAQDKLALAQGSRSDLEIRAPFSGTITSKSASNFDQIKTNQELFSLLSDEITPKVVAFLTLEEQARLLSTESIQVRFGDGTLQTSSAINVSSETDENNQKQKVEILFQSLPSGISVGSFAKIFVPSQSYEKNLLPLSSIGFEPSNRAEVLVVDEQDTTQRRSVVHGGLFMNAVEILEGLQEGERVVQYRNRAFAGEEIIPVLVDNGVSTTPGELDLTPANSL